MNFRILTSICLLLVVVASESVFAQSSSRLKRSRLYAGYNNFGIVKLTVGAGTSWYYGDVCEDCFEPRFNLNLGTHVRFSDRISAKAELNWYQIGADKDIHEARNATFKSNNIEALGAVVVDLFPHSVNYYSRKFVNPFIYGGIGFTYFNPRAELDGTTYSLRPLQTEGVSYSPVTLIVPGGVGLRFRVSHFLDVSVEGGYRLTFTDYLDDVSTVYTDLDDPTAQAAAFRGTTRAEGKKRGNPDSRDGYFVGGIKAEITLPSVRSGSGRGQRDSGAHISKLTKKNRKRMLKSRR